VAFTCIKLVLLLFFSISLEGALVETLLAILGEIYFIISWSFGMVKTLIFPYILGFVLLEMFYLLFWGFDYLISCGALHILGILHIHLWSWLPWDSHVDWLHAYCGPLAILEEGCCGAFS
jgi:hypothetical protein